MKNLISCDNCGIILNNDFDRDEETYKLFCEGEKIIFEYLEKRKYTIHRHYDDIEETLYIIKWCPVCKQVHYFSEIEDTKMEFKK